MSCTSAGNFTASPDTVRSEAKAAVRAAAHALARIGTAAVDPLIAVISDPNSSAMKRVAATWALAAMGRRAAAAVPALRRTMAGPDPALAEEAREALAKIE